MKFLSLNNTLLQIIESETISKPAANDIKALRQRLDLNTTQIGLLIGVSKRTWERYESGKLILSYSSWIYLLMIANELPGVRVLHIGDL